MSTGLVNSMMAMSIPILFILSIPLIFWIFSTAENRRNREIQETLRLMVEKGQQVSPELMETLLAPKKQNQTPENRSEKDLRWGVILCAVAIGVALFGLLDALGGPEYISLNQDTVQFGTSVWDEVSGWLGAAAFVLVIGLARLGLWKYRKG